MISQRELEEANKAIGDNLEREWKWAQIVQ
jgi:hypothetical protein